MTPKQFLVSFKRAVAIRKDRERVFDQAMRYSMPGRGSFLSDTNPDHQIDDVFDETAVVGTQEFASRLQSGMTPNFTRWAQLTAGAAVEEESKDEVDDDLEKVTEFVFNVISQSNFSQESYEAYLDCSVTLGCLEITEGTVLNPVRFHAVPITELYVNVGPFDALDQFFWMRKYTYDQFRVKYPDHKMDADKVLDWEESGKAWTFIEGVWRDWDEANEEVHRKMVLCKECDNERVFEEEYRGVGSSPFVGFRWSKEAGAVWGRGPLLNALPAIKTCNLVVQMVLENAQMSISGMYNMDDDATVNPETIELVPGTIIPRQPGSRGLEAVQPSGNFNVADIILNEQRMNIKRALYNDMLGNPDKTPASATEIAARMEDLSRQIGAAFGRLMAEMVQPIIQRVVYILKKRGLIELPAVNGQVIKVTATSPLSQAQDQADIMAVDRLLEFIQTRYGPQFVNIFTKGESVAPFVADKLQASADHLRSTEELKGLIEAITGQGGQVPGMSGEAGPPMPPDAAGGPPIA